jgi:hypothetical protein
MIVKREKCGGTAIPPYVSGMATILTGCGRMQQNEVKAFFRG